MCQLGRAPHPVALSQPVAQPPVTEGRGADHQHDDEDGQEGHEVTCSNPVTPISAGDVKWRKMMV